jgi:dissimilatory sulfite reductase (desulfoviridin) alpha/beta subunit
VTAISGAAAGARWRAEGTLIFCWRCIAYMRQPKVSSERYRQEVERIRRLAETFRSGRLLRELQDVARQYGELAKLAQRVGLSFAGISAAFLSVV